MSHIEYFNSVVVGPCLQGFFFGAILILHLPCLFLTFKLTLAGIYSGLFAMHLQYQASNKETKQNITFYAISVLYVSSVALFATNTAYSWLTFILEFAIEPVTCNCISFFPNFALTFSSPCLL